MAVDFPEEVEYSACLQMHLCFCGINPKVLSHWSALHNLKLRCEGQMDSANVKIESLIVGVLDFDLASVRQHMRTHSKVQEDVFDWGTGTSGTLNGE